VKQHDSEKRCVWFGALFSQRTVVLNSKCFISKPGLENAIFHLDFLDRKIKIITSGVFPVA